MKTLWNVYCNTDASGNERKDSHPAGWLQTVIKTLIVQLGSGRYPVLGIHHLFHPSSQLFLASFISHKEATSINIGMGQLPQVINFENNSLSPCVMVRLWILAESLFQSIAFICPSIPSQSVELFVCPPHPCQPWSLTNPPFFPPLYPSSSLSLLSAMSRKNLATLQGLLVETPSQVLTLHFRAEPIFILSNISNNFPTTIAEPQLHASCLRLARAYNPTWLDKMSVSTRFSESRSLSNSLTN